MSDRPGIFSLTHFGLLVYWLDAERVGHLVCAIDIWITITPRRNHCAYPNRILHLTTFMYICLVIGLNVLLLFFVFVLFGRQLEAYAVALWVARKVIYEWS